MATKKALAEEKICVTEYIYMYKIRLRKEKGYICEANIEMLLCSDRFRTTVNVVGDSLGAGIVNHMSKAELQTLQHAPQSQNGADNHTSENETRKM